MLTKKHKLRGPSSDFETIPAGIYTLQILDVDENTWEYKGVVKTGFKFTFGILDDEELPESKESTRERLIWDSRVADSIDVRSKLHKLAVAALGRPLTEEEQDPEGDNQLDVNDLIGLQVMASLENSDEDDNGRVWTNIKSYARARKQLEPMEYEPVKTETKRTATKPVRKVTPVEEDEEETGKVRLPNLNPALDDVAEEMDRKKSKPAVEKATVATDEVDDDEEELAKLEAAAAEARLRLAKAKKNKKAK